MPTLAQVQWTLPTGYKVDCEPPPPLPISDSHRLLEGLPEGQGARAGLQATHSHSQGLKQPDTASSASRATTMAQPEGVKGVKFHTPL